MFKKITLLFLAAVMVLSLVACSSDGRPALYDEEILTINGEKITYEFYRYYYLSAYQSYGEGNRDQIISDVIDKLLYDRAVDLILNEDKIALTAEEQEELDSMLDMYETTYGATFKQELEKQNMTVDVFKQTMTYMVKYNKLYENYAKEENKKLDFSSEGIKKVLEDYDAGLHFVINKGGNLNDKDARELAEQVYSMLAVSESFGAQSKLYQLKSSIKETEDAIEEINRQISEGSDDNTLVTTLSTLTKKLGELKASLSEKDHTQELKNELPVFAGKLEDYLEFAKNNVTVMLNSDHAELVSLMDKKDVEGISAYIAKEGVAAVKEKLCDTIKEVTDNVSSYGWLSADFKKACESFVASPTVEGAEAVMKLYSLSAEMKKDALLTNINTVLDCYCVLSRGGSCYQYRDALAAANGLFKISADLAVTLAEYGSCLEAEKKAGEIAAAINDGSLKANDISYDDLCITEAVVYDFEELIAKYSDGYNEEAETQMFYYQVDDLIDELSPVVSKLKVGEFTNVVESSTGFHIFKVIAEDEEHFKNNYFVYAALEEIIRSKAKTITYTTTELYDSLDEEKIESLEKQLAEQLEKINGTTTTPDSTEEPKDNTVLWTVIIIIATVAVVAVLAVAIVYSSKAPAPKDNRKQGKYKVSGKKDKK